MDKWNNKNTDNLIKAILSLKTQNEAKMFLRDILTEDEIIEFGLRLQVAQMLFDKISYSKITQITGLSSTTIARVAKWLNTGMDGYKTILNRMHQHKPSSTKRGLR